MYLIHVHLLTNTINTQFSLPQESISNIAKKLSICLPAFSQRTCTRASSFQAIGGPQVTTSSLRFLHYLLHWK